MKRANKFLALLCVLMLCMQICLPGMAETIATSSDLPEPCSHQRWCSNYVCLKCGTSLTSDDPAEVLHDWLCYDHCGICYAPAPEGVTTHHFYDETSFGYDANSHWELCTICDSPESAHDPYPHTFDADGKCSMCGYAPCHHVNWCVYSDNCLKCGVLLTENDDVELIHDWFCDGTCGQCGAPAPEGTDGRHWFEPYGYNDQFHWRICEFCNMIDPADTKAQHTFDESGKCTVCGYIAPPPCDHQRWCFSDRCMWCGTTLTGDDQVEPRHAWLCIGICDFCGEPVPEGVTGDHFGSETSFDYNADGHWELCDICGTPLYGTEPYPHSFNANGVCDYCGYDVNATPAPTAEPTAAPTAVPTAEPTAVPTAEPTVAPTAEPTAEPTAVPTAVPTAKPAAKPTEAPAAEAVVSEVDYSSILTMDGEAAPVVVQTETTDEGKLVVTITAETASDAGVAELTFSAELMAQMQAADVQQIVWTSADNSLTVDMDNAPEAIDMLLASGAKAMVSTISVLDDYSVLAQQAPDYDVKQAYDVAFAVDQDAEIDFTQMAITLKLRADDAAEDAVLLFVAEDGTVTLVEMTLSEDGESWIVPFMGNGTYMLASKK